MGSADPLIKQGQAAVQGRDAETLGKLTCHPMGNTRGCCSIWVETEVC